MKNYTDLSGLRFGNLTVLFPVHKLDGGYKYVCRCDCGNTSTVESHSLLHGITKTCGCRMNRLGELNHSYKHGLKHKHSRLYRIWKNMKRRCYTPSVPGYRYYGGRGICVCDEWKNDPVAFVNWAIDNGYSENLTIERIDNNGNYSPSNCRWATQKEQAQNTRRSIWFTYKGETHNLEEWANRIGVKPPTLAARLRHHTVEEAMSLPARTSAHKKIEYMGQVKTPTAWAKFFGVGRGRLSRALTRMSVEDAFAMFIPRKPTGEELAEMAEEETHV